MIKKFYTGIGSRSTPDDVLNKMFDLAGILENLDWTLRSEGQPKGADGAFYHGVKHTQNRIIYKPIHWSKRNDEPEIINEAYVIAAKHHPVWDKLPFYAKNLMARNVHAVLGDLLDNPSLFVVCWTPDGMNNEKPRTIESGGTGHTLSIANEYGIKIYNLKNVEDEEALNISLNGCLF